MHTPPRDDREHLKLLYEELKAALDRQIQELEGLDQKIAILLAANGVMISLVVVPEGAPRVGMVGVLLVVAAALLIVAWVVGAVALLPRRIKTAPEPSGLWPDYWDKTDVELLGDLCATIAYVFDKNGERSSQKLKLVYTQLALLMLALLLLFAAFAN